jgi:hypothetical protein
VDAPLGPVHHPDGQCLVHIEATVLDLLRAMRKPGESHSDVILRLVQHPPKRRTVKQRIKVFLAGGVLAFAAALATKVGRS